MARTAQPDLTILIVDDEFGILEVLEFILVDAGYSVRSAMNGHDALISLKKAIPDLAIVDCMMPIMDGPALINAMRNDDRFRDIPVILTSALPEPSVRDTCDGYNAFLRKPYKTDELMKELSRLLHNSKSR